MMSREARLHPAYQEVLSKAGVDDTIVVGRGFGVIRIIRNQFAEDMAKAEADGLPEEIRKSIFDKSSLKAAAFDGNVERGKVEAGQSIGLVSTVLPAAQIVADIAQDYARALAGLTRPVVDHNLKEINHAG
jgi:enoyl-[acyl-carrier protein] reductase II